MEYILRLVFSVVVAFLIAYAATPIVEILAFKIGAVDIPKDSRRMHKKPTPVIGGLAIFYGFIVSMLCFCDINVPIRGILLGGVIIMTLGFIDDCRDLNAILKFFIQILCALVVVGHGVVIEHFSNPFAPGEYFNLGMWSVPVTVLWIVGVTNAVNLIDGLDGLAVGVSAISSITLFTIAILTKEYNIAIMVAALAGACFGFLPYNFHPASTFMGDTGATFLGFVLGSLSVMGLFKGYTVISFAVPFLILGLPIFDTSFAIIRRLLKGQSPLKPDRGHLHHRLIDLGFNQKQAVTTLYIASALLSLAAVVLLLSDAKRAIIFIALVLFLAYVGIKMLSTKLKKDEENDKSEGEAQND